MPIDERKIIEDVEKESGGLRDYVDFVRLNAEYRNKRQQQKIIFAIGTLIVYVLLAFGFLTTFRNNTSLLFWPVRVSSSNELESLAVRVNDLDNQIIQLKHFIGTSTVSNISVDSLSSRLGSLEETISVSPEKALTAVLLREKQKNLEDNFLDLRTAQTKLSEKLDNFLTTVIFAPIIVALLGFLFWFIQSRLTKKDK